jgi:DNA-binding IclR family transcriptional regulator
MATIQHERIPLSPTYSATRDEIARVMAIITEQRNISVREIARQMGTGSTRVHHMIGYLRRMGFIDQNNKRRAWDVLIPVVEQRS